MFIEFQFSVFNVQDGDERFNVQKIAESDCKKERSKISAMEKRQGIN